MHGLSSSSVKKPHKLPFSDEKEIHYEMLKHVAILKDAGSPDGLRHQ